MEKTVPNDWYHPGCYKCAYCGLSTQKSKCLRRYPQNKWRYIFYCYAHRDDAERDMVSILNKLGYYRQSDILKQPLFAVLPEDLVKKSALGVGVGWFLKTSLLEDSIDLVRKDQDGTWTIAIDHLTPNIATYMPVSDLKMSLDEKHHGLVDDFIAWLSTGATFKKSYWCCF